MDWQDTITFDFTDGEQTEGYPTLSLIVYPGPGTPYAKELAVCFPYADINVFAEFVTVSYFKRVNLALESTLP